METQVVMGVHLPKSDTHFKEHLLKGPQFNGFGTYQHKKFQNVLPLIKQRHIALDIGAHVGLWSQPLAHYFHYVIAFEPVKELAECWVKNLERFPNATLFPFALGSRHDWVTMTYVPDNSGNTHISCDATESARPCVEMRPLDEIVQIVDGEQVNFIKIDTEGYEHDILRGAEKTIRKFKPVILVEQKPNNSERYGLAQGEAVRLLHSWGYATVWERSGDFALVHK